MDYQKILQKNLMNVFIDILKDIKKNGFDGNNHLYITFNTSHPNVSIPKWLLLKYPEEMTIVLQHEYYNLSVNNHDFNIGLSFNNKKVDLKIDYNSIISFADPNANFGLQLNNNIKNKKIKKNSRKKIKKYKKLDNVIIFDDLKKNHSK